MGTGSWRRSFPVPYPHTANEFTGSQPTNLQQILLIIYNGKRIKSLQQIVLGKLDVHMQNNKIEHLSHIIHTHTQKKKQPILQMIKKLNKKSLNP